MTYQEIVLYQNLASSALDLMTALDRRSHNKEIAVGELVDKLLQPFVDLIADADYKSRVTELNVLLKFYTQAIDGTSLHRMKTVSDVGPEFERFIEKWKTDAAKSEEHRRDMIRACVDIHQLALDYGQSGPFELLPFERDVRAA